MGDGLKGELPTLEQSVDLRDGMPSLGEAARSLSLFPRTPPPTPSTFHLPDTSRQRGAEERHLSSEPNRH